MYNHSIKSQDRHNFYSLGDKPHGHELFDVSHIHKNIYIGDKNTALNKAYLKKMNIKHILVAGEELETKFQSQFNYLKIPIKDTIKTNILQIFQKTNEFIDNSAIKKENILIHCAFGVSRSASILIAYMIYKFKLSYEEAFHYVKQRRPQVKPNEGFREQLKKYSQDIKSK